MVPAELSFPVTKNLMANVSLVAAVLQLAAFANERPCASRPGDGVIWAPVTNPTTFVTDANAFTRAVHTRVTVLLDRADI